MADESALAGPEDGAATRRDARALAGRLKALEQAESAVPAWSGTGTAGIALSGGGIRSATVSLGMVQALAARGLLGRFDYISTVSGGGYAGAFLRSLFLPAGQRGPGWRDPADLPPGKAAKQTADQHRFATAALASHPGDRQVLGERNPLWWLREHSRYLAPNGPSDYAAAASYLARNWIAMLYVFALAVAGLFAAVTLLLAAILRLSGVQGFVARFASQTTTLPATGTTGALVRTVHLSPWLLLGGVAVVAAAACALAYWITVNMRANPQPIGAERPNEPRDAARRLASAAIPTALAALLVGIAVVRWDFSRWIWSGGWPSPIGQMAGQPAKAIVTGGTGFILAGVLIGVVAYFLAFRAFPNPTAEVRRRLTAWLTRCNIAALAFLAAGVCDSLALALRARLPALWHGGVGPLASAVLIPIGAFLINRLSSLFGGRAAGGGMIGFLVRHISAVLLVAGVLLYGGVAVLVDAAVQALIWRGPAWGADGIDPRPAIVLALVLAALGWLTGRSRGFINLSSLHQLYAARLTRAYLGATNRARLRSDGGHTIKESDACDHVEPRAFFAVPTAAPVPLMMVTLNETIAPRSRLIARERKGAPLVLGPDGIRLDHERVASWTDLANAGAEALSMGQWIAISGAAASAGMGRLTTLGGALTFTFANVRLGYWWRHGGALIQASTARSKRGGLLRRVGSAFDTFVYLFDEMTARYSRTWRRVYLSDGGHFENSGAYALLDRRVGVILLCDNGADPLYRFDDLEQLVRKARLDLHAEVEPLTAEEVARLAGGATRLFLNAEPGGDWHARLDDPARFALLLRARFHGEARTSLIVWIKPRALPLLSPDVAGYARLNPAFPQQSTGDQFFDEAQWESYRKLGEQMTELLLREAGPGFLDNLRRASGR